MALLVLTLVLFTSVGTAFAQPKAADYLSYTEITVQAGDTLWGLLREYSNSADFAELLPVTQQRNRLNNLEIQAGQKLYIPVMQQASGWQ
jgi:LysM repeat protein